MRGSGGTRTARRRGGFAAVMLVMRALGLAPAAATAALAAPGLLGPAQGASVQQLPTFAWARHAFPRLAATGEGPAIAALFVLRDHVIAPILAGVRSPRLGRKPATWTTADRHYEQLRIRMQPCSRAGYRGLDNSLSLRLRQAARQSFLHDGAQKKIVCAPDSTVCRAVAGPTSIRHTGSRPSNPLPFHWWTQSQR